MLTQTTLDSSRCSSPARLAVTVLALCIAFTMAAAPGAAASADVATDRDVLVAFYQATDGANWGNSANWLSDQPTGAWYGVTTNSNGRVTRIELPDNRLDGTIPLELGNLTALTWLDLQSSYIEGGNTDRNRLRGSIPPELGNLTNLEWLDLEGNQLSGAIPPALGQLTDLEWLDIGDNELSGSIPSELGNLNSLTDLFLEGNELSGSIPSELGNLNNLEWLWLHSNQLVGSIPSELGKLTNLTVLDLYSNELSGEIPSQLGSLTNLTRLDLGDNRLSGEIPSELGSLTNLTRLWIEGNRLSGEIPLELGNLTNLIELHLSGNELRGCVPAAWRNVTDNDLDSLGLPFCGAPSAIDAAAAATDRDVLVALFQATDGASWRNSANWLSAAPLDAWHGVTTDDSGRVIELDLSENGLSGEIPPALGTLSNLTKLWLYSNQLSGSIPAALGNLANLTSLRLFGNQLRGEIPPALGQLTNLERLDLDDNGLSGSIPPELGNLAKLTWLDLFSNQLSGTIPSELSNLTNLEVLRLFSNQLSGSIPSALGNLTNLTELYLSGNGLTGCVPEVWRNVAKNDLDILGLPFCVTPSTTGTTDRDLLAALYQATNGANWEDNANWLSDAPLDAWHGVTTDDSGRVIELDLPENRLSGKIPAELANLAALTHLRLSGNELSGSIPSELGNLPNLGFLVLSGNELSGSIPSELGHLTNLTWLALAGNELNGSIPPELGNLPNLTVLALWGNELSGSIPSELGQLPNLIALFLDDNELSGDVPSELGQLTNLAVLSLAENGLSGEIPSELGQLGNLLELALAGNELRGCVPEVWRNVETNDLDSLGLPFCGAPSATDTVDREALVALYQATDGASWENSDNWLSAAPLNTWHGVTTGASGRVTALDLSENGLSGEPPPELGNLTDLTALLLHSNQLSGEIPSELGNLNNLEVLRLAANQLSGAIPSELGNLNNLVWLNLYSNQLSGEIPPELGHLNNLVFLWLDNNPLRGCVPEELWRNVAGHDLDGLELPLCAAPTVTDTTDREALVALYQAANGAGWLNSANWLSDAPLGAWHGVTTDASGRVTALALSENRLSGEIPAALGNLTNLTSLSLAGNQLSGCVPAAWRNVAENDLDGLGLPYCAASSATVTAMAVADKDVLVAFYHATDGASWLNSANWLSAAPLAAWHGVTADEGGRVIALNLTENRLSGSIPSALGNLNNLIRLDLASNQLSGEIPSQLGNLTNLTALNLAGNELSGAVLSTLGDLINLRALLLGGNQLSGSVPSALGNLTNLRSLSLAGNQLSGSVPSELGRLTNLTVLHLAGNRLSGEIPSQLGNLSNLIWLTLAGNQLSGCVPADWPNVAENDLDSLGLSFCAAPSATDITDREALVALYNVTDGANWKNNSNWLSDQQIGAWYGVTTNSNGRVTGIELPDNRLRGTIPSELGNLSNLTALRLYENELSGGIPPELSNLANLTELNLSYNELSGGIPPELSNLANLTELDLSYNELSGEIPSWLGNLTNLTELHLESNRLSGAIQSALGKLNNLTVLHLHSNQLSGEIPSWLGNLTSLAELGLGGNQLGGEIPSELGKLTNLTGLALGGNQLSGPIPSWLGNLTNLEVLSLAGNRLSGEIPAELGSLTNLELLYLSGNRISGCVPAVWRNVEENDLGSLGLPFCVASSATGAADREALIALYQAADGDNWWYSANWLSDAPLGAWHGVTTDASGRVIELDLRRNRLSGSIPPELGNLTNLTGLNLSGNDLNSIPSELGNLTNLTRLDLRDNGLRGEIPSELENLTNLTAVYLSGNELRGCVPKAWRNVAVYGLRSLGLPFCAALSATDAATATTDREALVALYNATDGANWLNSANWLSDAPLGAWRGVTTDESGRVITLDLSGNGLNGEIPSELGNLTNLAFLSLWDNQLSGEIPPELGNLTNLTALFLFSNQLNGSIPSELGNLTNLTALFLLENELSGEIPSKLGNLTNLTALALWSNQLSGEIPSELGNLTNLTQLYLWGNRLSGSIPSALGNLTNLTELGLSENGLSGEIPPELGNLINLKLLSLAGNQLRGCVPAVWRNVETNDLDSLGLPFCAAPSATDAATTSVTDRDVLVALYRAMNGANWENSANWLSDAPLDTWHGVTTDGSGRVIELDLPGNQLSGTIPSELGELTNLRQLSLGKNDLSGAIPPQLGRLTYLKWLYLHENNLSGTVPSELGRLTDLESLGLWDNELSGAIPPALGNLTNLRQLSLSGNRLSGTVPSELGQLAELEILNLWDNDLSGAILPALGQLTKLTTLYLSENALRGCVPAVWRNVEENDLDAIGLPFCGAATDRAALVALYQAANSVNWKNNANWLSAAPLDTWHGVTTDESGRVIGLDLRSNGLIGSIPSELGHLTNLKALDLRDNWLSGSIPSELGHLTNLKALDLRDNWLSGSIPSELGHLTNLKALNLYSNRLSGSIPSALGSLTNLTRLDLRDNWLSGSIPAELGNLINLTALYLADNELSGEIPAALGNLINLIELWLYSNQLRGSIPVELGNLNNLTALYLSENGLSGEIPPELGNLTNLITLYLSGNQLRGCVPAAWRNVAVHDLESLGLSFCAAPSATGAATDREALIALYQATNGANWRNSANWLSDAPLATWHGVTTDKSGRVTALDLSENGLSGEIPSELGHLTNLTGLLLAKNELSGAIPSELGQLTNLTVLYLRDNQLSGSIPSQLGQLTNLEFLVLGGNQLGGAIPSELGQLTNLTGLDLAENELSGAISSDLGHLTNLTVLYLRGNGLSGCVPEVWRNVEENDLESLGLPFCVAPSPRSTASSESLTSGQIFQRVLPAFAFIETATSAAGGVLIEGGYLVTNAHVVWPYAAARVLFPDGTEIEQVAVKGWDLLADLAVLGPIDVPVEPVTLLDWKKIPIASDIYLVGYPNEVEAVPQPAIARGVLSRLREWEPVGVTYFQTDAAITGGRSGGLLVSDTGGVIGISGFRVAGREFGLFASSADILPRIRQLIAGEDPAGLGERLLPAAGGKLRHALTLRNYWDELGYLINGPAGAEIELELIGESDGGISVFDAAGNELLVLDDELTGAETGSLVAQGEGPRFLIAWQLNETAADFTLTASHRLVPLNDPERGGQLQVGQTVRGNIDFPADIDHFLLHLEENETVEIVARSALADILLTVDYPGAVGEQVVRDDDSGGGLFGLDARIIYRAPHSGSYFVVVSDVGRSAPGGYIVSVNPADPGDASQQSAPSEFGLAQLRSAFTGLPASYTEIDPALMEISPENMADTIDADAQFSHLVGFLTSDGPHLIMAASGQLTGAERVAAFDRALSEAEQALLTESAVDLWQGSDPQSIGLLEMSPVGDKSLGLSLEFIDEGAPIPMEMLFFRRGNLVAWVITMSLGPHDAQEIVSAEQAARALDAQMSRYLLAEQAR